MRAERNRTMLPADRLTRLVSGRRVAVQLPASAGQWGCEAVGSYLLAAWVPGIPIVVADLTSVVSWHDGWPDGLLAAHRDLASSQAELRLVVWAADLYEALRRTTSCQLSVYTSLDAALQAP